MPGKTTFLLLATSFSVFTETFPGAKLLTKSARLTHPCFIRNARREIASTCYMQPWELEFSWQVFRWLHNLPSKVICRHGCGNSIFVGHLDSFHLAPSRRIWKLFIFAPIENCEKKPIWFRRPSERMCRGVKHLPCFLCRDPSPPSR